MDLNGTLHNQTIAYLKFLYLLFHVKYSGIHGIFSIFSRLILHGGGQWNGFYTIRNSLMKELIYSFSVIRTSHRRCSIKKLLLKNFAVFRGKHLCQRIFLIKLQAFRYATLLKRDCNTDVFLWFLWNFWEYPFGRISANGYF